MSLQAILRSGGAGGAASSIIIEHGKTLPYLVTGRILCLVSATVQL